MKAFFFLFRHSLSLSLSLSLSPFFHSITTIDKQYAFSAAAAVSGVKLDLVPPPSSVLSSEEERKKKSSSDDDDNNEEVDSVAPLILQPPEDERLGDAAAIHYTWGTRIVEVEGEEEGENGEEEKEEEGGGGGTAAAAATTTGKASLFFFFLLLGAPRVGVRQAQDDRGLGCRAAPEAAGAPSGVQSAVAARREQPERRRRRARSRSLLLEEGQTGLEGALRDADGSGPGDQRLHRLAAGEGGGEGEGGRRGGGLVK